jgi:hypothetical protein
MAKTKMGGGGGNSIASIVSAINESMKMGTVAFDYGKEDPLHIKQ